MKRRTIFKVEHAQRGQLGFSRGGGTSSKSLQASAKKTSKKRPARSASSILGLKNAELPTKECKPWCSEESFAVDHVAECQRLREQLERVLIDHQRQEEEIVALRALAKSLKEEVETIHARQQLQSSVSSSDKIARMDSQVSCLESHEFFKLDVKVEELQGENTELRLQLEIAQEELKSANACIAQKLPVYKLAAVKANAELRCVKSQLQQERAHSDCLQKQIVRYKARKDDVAVRVSPERGNNQEEHEDDSNESEAIRREREIFLQQCMRLQDDEAPNHKQNTTTKSSDIVSAIEKQTAFGTDFESSSKEPNGALKTDKLIDEGLHGLEFSIDELNLSD